MSAIYRSQAEYDAATDSSPAAREKERHAYEMSCDWAGRCPRCARDTRVFKSDTARLARRDPSLCNTCFADEPTWKPGDPSLFKRAQQPLANTPENQ